MNAFRLDFDEITLVPTGNFLDLEMATAIDRRVRLGDNVILFLIGGQVVHLLRYTTILEFTVRRLKETELVDARVETHCADQTDVRAFRCFNRTNASVM